MLSAVMLRGGRAASLRPMQAFYSTGLKSRQTQLALSHTLLPCTTTTTTLL